MPPECGDCHCQSMLPLFTVTCVNCDKLSNARPWMPPGRWSRFSLPVACIGATHCTTASLTSWCDVRSRCRILRPGWSLAHDDVTTSHRCFASCTGFQRVSYKIVTLVHLCLSQATWLTTADSSPTPASDDCVLLTLKHWSSVAHKVLLATEHSLRWNSLPSDIRQSDLSYGQFQMVTSLGEVDLC